MSRSRLIYAGKSLAVLAVVPIVVFSYSSGPPEKSSGAPGDNGSCAQADCHVGQPENANGNKIEVTFAGGDTYTPGTAQRITIRITEPATVYGFQMTARDSSNNQAGRFTAAESNIAVLCSDGSTRTNAGNCRADSPFEYIEHTQPKQTGQFAVEWTPPANAIGPIRFFVSANAANGNSRGPGDTGPNGGRAGDKIYTASFTLNPAGSSGPRPAIGQNGIVNAASFTPGLQSGAWASIFGTNFPAGVTAWNIGADGLFPTELAGVRVTVGGKPAYIKDVINGQQINFQVPDDIGTGNVAVEVTTPNGTSVAAMAEVRTAAPAFFAVDIENRRFAAAVHTTALENGVYVLRTAGNRPAKPGDVVLLFGNSFGPTRTPVPAGRVFTGASPLITPPRITIGGVEAQVQFAGLSGAGLYQFNVLIPDVPNGDHPVVAELPGGMSTPNNVVIPIQR